MTIDEHVSELAKAATAIGAFIVSGASLWVSWQASQLNRRSLSEGIKPILTIDFEMSRFDTQVSLWNKGMGVAVITKVTAQRLDPLTRRIIITSDDPFRLFCFDPEFDWNACKTFSPAQRHFLPPNTSYVLFHINQDFLTSQRGVKDWISDDTIVDVCHLINHVLGEIRLLVEIENARGEKLPAFEYDFRNVFPLPNTPDPRNKSSTAISTSISGHRNAGSTHRKEIFSDRTGASEREPLSVLELLTAFGSDVTTSITDLNCLAHTLFSALRLSKGVPDVYHEPQRAVIIKALNYSRRILKQNGHDEADRMVRVAEQQYFKYKTRVSQYVERRDMASIHRARTEAESLAHAFLDLSEQVHGELEAQLVRARTD